VQYALLHVFVVLEQKGGCADAQAAKDTGIQELFAGIAAEPQHLVVLVHGLVDDEADGSLDACRLLREDVGHVFTTLAAVLAVALHRRIVGERGYIRMFGAVLLVGLDLDVVEEQPQQT
jgi:hypothetical protein